MFLTKTKIKFIAIILIVFGIAFLIFSKTAFTSKEMIIQEKEAEKNIVSFKDMLGSNFIIGFMGIDLDDETRDVIRYIKPSGIIIYARNCEDGNQLKNLIKDLQEVAKELGNKKFFIMIDEEPGGATRINAFDNAFISNDPDLEIIEEDFKVMSDLGINVNLAPVADYAFNNDSFIKERIPVSTVEELIAFNNNFIKISQENNVSATLKHFPGMGFFEEDPHRKIPDSDVNKESFEKSLEIFKSGIDAEVDFVMIGHAIYKNIDKEITSLSSKVIKDILIDKLDFKGLIITDDIADMPLLVGKKIEIDEATMNAFKAGNNLVLFSHRPENTKNIFDHILEKGESDEEFKLVIEQNYEKITDFKNNHIGYNF